MDNPSSSSEPSSVRSSYSSTSVTQEQLQHFCGHCKRSLQVASQQDSTKPSVFTTCEKCQKVHYCSLAHKKAHAAKHEKSGCFPAYIHSSPECGRFWVASRDIAMDEVIFKEKALVLAPNVPCVSPLYPTCLGCNRGTNTAYRCSKCGWPMCGKKCEKISNHSKFECKIFRKNGIESNCRPQHYFFIQFLRALLLKESDPQGFAQLMELESHVKARKQVKEEVFMMKSFYKFLTEDCNLDYDFQLADHVVGVNRVNCYSADGMIHGKKRFCSAVFPKLSLINHHCRPNTRTILHEERSSDNSYALYMELRASVDIAEGEEISQQYISSTKGTLLRQESLSDDWFFQCHCDRCKDASEYNSFFSAVKCTNCPEGYLLPVDPIQADSIWKCGVIEDVESENKDVQGVVQKFYSLEKGCGYEKRGDTVRCFLEEIERQAKLLAYNPQGLQKLLTEFSFHSLHPNHYLLINIKYGIVDDIVKKINYSMRESQAKYGLENGLSYEDRGGVSYDEILKAIKYSKDVLAVTRKICLGRSSCIGIVLYFLGICLVELKLRKFPCKFTEAQVENVLREAWTILHVEAQGTTYREMAANIEERCLAMNLNNLSF